MDEPSSMEAQKYVNTFSDFSFKSYCLFNFIYIYIYYFLQLKDLFAFLYFTDSTEQLVEALLSVTSSLLIITGFIQEVISPKRE